MNSWIRNIQIESENYENNLGDRPDGFSIDRIDGDKNYEPGNVRWADKKTQSLNRNRNYKRREL